MCVWGGGATRDGSPPFRAEAVSARGGCARTRGRPSPSERRDGGRGRPPSQGEPSSRLGRPSPCEGRRALPPGASRRPAPAPPCEQGPCSAPPCGKALARRPLVKGSLFGASLCFGALARRRRSLPCVWHKVRNSRRICGIEFRVKRPLLRCCCAAASFAPCVTRDTELEEPRNRTPCEGGPCFDAVARRRMSPPPVLAAAVAPRRRVSHLRVSPHRRVGSRRKIANRRFADLRAESANLRVTNLRAGSQISVSDLRASVSQVPALPDPCLCVIVLCTSCLRSQVFAPLDPAAAQKFLHKHDLDLICRAHQAPPY